MHKKVYTFSSIRAHSIPKSLKCGISVLSTFIIIIIIIITTTIIIIITVIINNVLIILVMHISVYM